MKKFIVFSLVCLFSFLFFKLENVDASTINIGYTDSQLEVLDEQMPHINDMYNYLLNNNYITSNDILYLNPYSVGSVYYIFYLIDRNIYLSNSTQIFSNKRFYFYNNYSFYTVGSGGGITLYPPEQFANGYFIGGSENNNYTITNGTSNDFYLSKNEDYLFLHNSTISVYEFAQHFIPTTEPSYTLQQQVLENGNVKLIFSFSNYNSDSNYGFTITNRVSGEEYGIANPFTSIYPNIIPFGNSYEIELDYNTVITVSLSKYNLIEGTELYDREPIFVDSYDINNIVFENNGEPYFSIIHQTKNNIIGKFNNTKNNYTCFYKYSNSNIENNVSCNETLDLTYNYNGFIEVIIKNNNSVLYTRKINLLGGDETQPYIVYNVVKQDFYSKINWYVNNYNNQLKYRYSLDNGSTFTTWTNLSSENQFINVYQNSVVIIEISDSSETMIYDSKAINVVVSVENLKNFNNTTNNLVDKFNNIFNVNSNILSNIENYWNSLKTTKLYLLIFVPFLTSIICAIIHLIRR